MNGFKCFLEGLHVGDMGMIEQGKIALLLSAEIDSDGKFLGFHLTGSGYSMEKKEHREWFNVSMETLSEFRLVYGSVDVSNNTKIINLPDEYHPIS